MLPRPSHAAVPGRHRLGGTRRRSSRARPRRCPARCRAHARSRSARRSRLGGDPLAGVVHLQPDPPIRLKAAGHRQEALPLGREHLAGVLYAGVGCGMALSGVVAAGTTGAHSPLSRLGHPTGRSPGALGRLPTRPAPPSRRSAAGDRPGCMVQPPVDQPDGPIRAHPPQPPIIDEEPATVEAGHQGDKQPSALQGSEVKTRQDLPAALDGGRGPVASAFAGRSGGRAELGSCTLTGSCTLIWIRSAHPCTRSVFNIVRWRWWISNSAAGLDQE